MTSGISKSIRISLGDKLLAQFLEELADFAVSIEKSRYVLHLEKDFDGMNSEPPSARSGKAARLICRVLCVESRPNRFLQTRFVVGQSRAYRSKGGNHRDSQNFCLTLNLRLNQ
ncbi:MAG: hypothetical protein ACKVU0_03255 [Saprospiraceae bacterium]